MKKVAAIILIVCIGIMMIAVSGCQKKVEPAVQDVAAQADSAATAAIDTAAAAVAETVQEVAQ